MGKRVQGQAFLDGVIDHGALLHVPPRHGHGDEHARGLRLMNWETGYGDWIAEPVWDPLRVLPWLEKTAIVLADTVDEETHEEIPVSPRTILKRQVARAAAPASPSRPAPSSSTTSSRTVGGALADAGWPSRSGSATTTRTTTSSRPPRPSRCTACCATR